MSRRRLNKKVALVGSTVFLLLALGCVFIILRLSRNPAQFIADGDAAVAAGDYESARRNYEDAIKPTTSPQEKVDLFFKLAHIHILRQDWNRVRGCWQQIVTYDPRNLRARMGQLKYSYVLADSLSEVGQSLTDCWGETLKQATELLDVAATAGVLDKPRAQWEPSFGAVEEPRWVAGNELLGPCLYFIKGRAAYEMAALGEVTAPKELLEQAQTSLLKAKESDPNNAEIYYYLAQVAQQKGENADDLLAEGVKATGGAPEASIHVLTRRLMAARTGSVAAVRSQMRALRPEYEALAEKSPENPQALAALARFHAIDSMYAEPGAVAASLDRAVAAADKARTLDPRGVAYVRLAARLYYRRYSLFGDEAALARAVELSEQGLSLPGAQDVPGPRQHAGQANRLMLYTFLARCYTDRLLTLDKAAPQRAELLSKAEKAVHEIEQLRGSGRNPQVVMWQGMLDLVRGDTGKAVRSLDAAYEQIKASTPLPEQRDAFLSYTLGRIFEDTMEVGAVVEFLESALNSDILDSKPQALLDYGHAFIRARSHDDALKAVSVYEERFGATRRSRVLGIEALIGKGRLDEAQEAISRLSPQDPNALRLEASVARVKGWQLRAAIRQKSAGGESSVQTMTAELQDCRRREADLMLQLLKTAPAIVEEQDAASLCGALIEQNDAATARKLAEAYLAHSPDSVEMRFCRGVLSEPDPANCTDVRRREIREQAIQGIADPVRRSMALAVFYQQQEQYDKAAAQWREVLDQTSARTDEHGPAYLKNRQVSPRHVAASYLFDLARQQQDWKLAQDVAAIAKAGNLDDCEGYLFAGRLAFAKGDHKEALACLNECLKLRPIFSYGYMLRGNIHAAMDNERASIEDFQKAVGLNPVDPVVTKALANALYVRNSKLGDRLSSSQESEARQAVERAVRLDQTDAGLLNIYAQMVGKDEPMKALALRQTIQVNAPSVANGVALGALATDLALKETDLTKKQSLFAMAESAFEQARKLEPANQYMLESYAQHYRARGQDDKASQLLADSQDSRLLWRHHFREGRLDEARKLLQQMYDEPKSRPDALKGLVLIAEEAADKDNLKKHSEELLGLEDNLTNRLVQIRAYLDVGLTQEAQDKLQSFKQKYPDEPRVTVMEALLAKRQGDPDRALELVDRSLQTNPNDASAWRLRGEIETLKGNYDRAVSNLTRSRTLEDDPVATMLLAKAYVGAGKEEQAVSELRAILDKAWNDERMLADVLLRAYHLVGADEVSAYCRQRLGAAPDSLPANYAMFNLARIKEAYSEADACIDKCVALSPSGTPQQYERMAEKAQLLAVAYKKTSDNAYLEKAVVAYESLLAKTPKNSSSVALNNLAYLLAQSGVRLADALEYAKEALRQKPNEANYLDTYGYVLYRSGRHADALASLTAAVRQHEVEGACPADVYEHLGLAHEALGDNHKALAAYRRALEAGAGTMPKPTKDRIDSAVARVTK